MNGLSARRLRVLLAAFVLFSGAVSYRVVSFAVLQGPVLAQRAEAFRYREDIVPAHRGYPRCQGTCAGDGYTG